MAQVRIIKKYPNRRLYDTEISSYITLEEVRQLVLDDEDFEVRDAKTGDDLTRSVLLQIISEHEETGQPMFTTQLLSQVIRFYGDSMQGFMGSYLEKSLQIFLDQQQKFRSQLNNILGQTPWSMLNDMTERNVDLWKSVQEGFLTAAAGSAKAAPAQQGRQVLKRSGAPAGRLTAANRLSTIARLLRCGMLRSARISHEETVDMSKRIALVTGGIGGLGTEICKHLARSGRVVVACDLASRAERVAEFQQETAEFADRSSSSRSTSATSKPAPQAIKAVEAKYGPVDILVNAAGITRDTTLRKMSPQQWVDVLRINLDGVFNMCRHVVEGMSERGFGRIVNISSVNGQTGQFGQTNYSAAKAGMHGFTMALAREVARKGVTVNSVSPGYCRTAMVAGDCRKPCATRSSPAFRSDASANRRKSRASSISSPPTNPASSPARTFR